MDLEKKYQAIKMSWIVRLFDENCPGKFKYTVIEILNQYKQANLGKSVFKTFLSTHFDCLGKRFTRQKMQAIKHRPNINRTTF